MAKDDSKEEMFAAWRDWDCEVSDLQKKREARERLNSAIDLYKKEAKSGSPRWAVMFYFRKEYAKWRLKNR